MRKTYRYVCKVIRARVVQTNHVYSSRLQQRI